VLAEPGFHLVGELAVADIGKPEAAGDVMTWRLAPHCALGKFGLWRLGQDVNENRATAPPKVSGFLRGHDFRAR
jgi:hypothetical protein